MDKLTVDQLKELAKEYKIKGRSKLRRKSDLLKELRKIPELVEMYDNVEPQLGTPQVAPRLPPVQAHHHAGHQLLLNLKIKKFLNRRKDLPRPQ